METDSSELQVARQLLAGEHFQEALDVYFKLLASNPDLRPLVKHEFCYAVEESIADMSASEQLQQYKAACAACPCDVLMNNLGGRLFKWNCLDEAGSYFQAALRLNPNFEQARENLQNIAHHLVERWHFPMLNDQHRNQQYYAAIAEAVSNGFDCVLDIGTGTGLLSMMCARAGATEIFACDMSKTMIDLAADVLDANGLTESINLIHAKSNDLSVPASLPKRVNLVVTETLDAGLLGEHIIPTVIHAWDELLLPPGEDGCGGRVLPEGAVVYACLVQCDAVANSSRLSGLQTDQGVRVATTPLHLVGCELIDDGTSARIEPYTSENMTSIRGGYTQLSETVQVAELNFNDPIGLASLLGASDNIQFPVATEGRVDAVMAWFDLSLVPGVEISTAPGRDGAWEQAVFPLLEGSWRSKLIDEHHAPYSNDGVLHVCECCVVTASVSYGSAGDELSICCEERRCPKDDRVRYCNDLPEDCLKPVPPTVVEKLNDGVLLHALSAVLCQTVAEAKEGGGSVCVHDLAEDLSAVPVVAAVAGAGAIVVSGSVDELLVASMLAANTIVPKSVKRRADGSLRIRLVPEVPHGETLTVIVGDLLSSSGMLNPHALEDLTMARMTIPESVVLPCRLRVCASVITSSQISEQNRVWSDERVLGFDIARYINAFGGSTIQNVSLRERIHDCLTPPFCVLDMDLSRNDQVCSDTSGDILVSASRSGLVTGVAYWFEEDFSPGSSVVTGPYCACYRSDTVERGHWKQCVALVASPFEVQAGDWLSISAALQSSCVAVSVQPRDDELMT